MKPVVTVRMCAGGDVDWSASASRDMLLRALEALLGGNAGSLTDLVVVSVPGCAAGRMQPLRQLRAVAASPPPPLPPGAAAPPASPSSTLQISVQTTSLAGAQSLTALLSDAQASPAGAAALAGAFQAAGLATTSLAVSAVELTESPSADDASAASPAAAADSGSGRLLGLLALLCLLLLLCCCCFAVWRRRGREVVPFAATVALRWPVDGHDPTSLTLAVVRHMRAERPDGNAPVALPRVMRRKLAAAMASALQATGADVIDCQLQECVASWRDGSAKAPVLRLAARAFFVHEPPPRDEAGEDAEGGCAQKDERSAQFARMLPPARARHSRPPPDGAVTSALRRQSNCGDVRAVWLWRELPALLRGAGGSSVASSAVDEPQASSPSAHKAATARHRAELHTLAPPARLGRATTARRGAAMPLPPTPIGEEESIMPPPAATAAAAGTSAAVVVAIPQPDAAQPADAAESPDAAPEEEAPPVQPGCASDGDATAYTRMVRDLFKTY